MFDLKIHYPNNTVIQYTQIHIIYITKAVLLTEDTFIIQYDDWKYVLLFYKLLKLVIKSRFYYRWV